MFYFSSCFPSSAIAAAAAVPGKRRGRRGARRKSQKKAKKQRRATNEKTAPPEPPLSLSSFVTANRHPRRQESAVLVDGAWIGRGSEQMPWRRALGSRLALKPTPGGQGCAGPRRRAIVLGPSRSVAQPGSALHWGCRGRGFKSRRSDQFPCPRDLFEPIKRT
jgi:hypothetical protein